ncbi:MAG: hypothetical protein JSS66_15430 [Armatimonadetes bacterium]|nr:hypothetical protein [Armatimonadota bacterium]
MAFRLSILVVSLLLTCAGAHAQTEPTKESKEAAEKARLLKHPLDPLTEEEVKTVRKVMLDSKTATRYAQFASVCLSEPSKSDVLSFKPGDAIQRKAKVFFYEPKANESVEAIVDIDKKTVEKSTVVKKQSTFGREDNQLSDRLLRTNPDWLAALKKRGIDPLDAGVGTMPNRGYVDVKPDGSRYVLAVTYVDDKVNPGEVSDLLALVNVTKRKVEWVRDGGGSVRRSDADEDPTNPDRLEPTRTAPKALKTTMPDGATWTMEGSELKWQNWRFRIGTDPRVGLVLYTVGYEDGGKVRPVLYRASLSELFVPYGDPKFLMVNWFDAGEFGMNTAFPSSFVPGNDAPENAKFLSAMSVSPDGRPRTLPNSIAVYERDGGVLWRHGGESRRARDLVVASIHQAGNYDYIFNWVFHQDGSIEVQVDLTGYMETRNVERDKDPDEAHNGSGKELFGTLVAPRIEAVNHQHFFSFRLDMDVDGPVKNQIYEMNVKSADRKANPQPNGMAMTETLLRTEASAERDVDAAAHRCWKIVNNAVRNKFNQPSAYMLIPGETAVPYSAPDSYLRRISRFTEHQLWVTPFDPTQLYAAGSYVFDGDPDDGLPVWTKGNRSIEYEDVVLYYTVGVTHVPRVEDWPIMATHHAGFRLVPAGFFSSNPAIGVPTTKISP